MDNIKLSFSLVNSSNHEDLSVEVWLDDQKFYDSFVMPGNNKIQLDFPEDDSSHQLKIILKDKTVDHTVVDEDNNILEDVVIDVVNLEIDEIEIDQYLFTSQCEYVHDCNGTEELMSRDFYGHLGCNGEVVFKFTTPLYVWLLEHM